MTVRNLQYLFAPRSIAVIGASNRPQSVGATVMRNLVQSGFSGSLMPVNPRWDKVADLRAYKSVAELPDTAELAVICTPAATVPGIISELAARGTKAAIVLTAGFEVLEKEAGGDFRKAVLEAARPHLLRVLGPNCVGVLAPHAAINASFAHMEAKPGKLAFVSQSGALATAVLDWANARDIGFSHFISVGNAWDVDFGDLLDYLGGDAKTKAILLYIESITSARKFMSAARAAARNKPVILIKAGRFSEGAAAAATHTGALAGEDDVYDAAIRRAGMLRVKAIEDLFDMAELLGRDLNVKGDRLAIVTNGGGAGVMAADALAEHRSGRLARLGAETVAKLDAVLPANWSRGNPVDIIGDAPIERYLATLDALADGKDCDAILLIQAPTAIVPSPAIAEAMRGKAKQGVVPLLTCWLGGATAEEARSILSSSHHATFETPESAIGAFCHLVEYRRNQTLLLETPPSVPDTIRPDRAGAAAVVAAALGAGRNKLTEPEAKAVLASYRIPVVATHIARDAGEACAMAGEIGYPVALKILSDDISHKSDFGGVVLDLADQDHLVKALEAMCARISESRPDARIKGFTVQSMARRPGAFELILGCKSDSVFGPVIVFGAGGTSVEVVADRAVGLPPMNMAIARRLVEETRIARLLKGYRNVKPVALEDLYFAILKLSQLVCDIPEIKEIDINPLLADERGVLALDARIVVERTGARGVDRLAIRPYPTELQEKAVADGETILVRPICPEDEKSHRVFLESTSSQDVYFRFFGMIRQFEHSQLARLTQIDYDREMAFIAEVGEGAAKRTIGVVRVTFDPDNTEAEFAIIVHADFKGRGIGRLLMRKMIAYVRSRGTPRIVGKVLRENERMLALAAELGFKHMYDNEPGSVSVAYSL